VTPYYQDDAVTIYHGDCRQIDAWLAADVMVTDPPYGIAHRSGHSSPLYGAVAERYQSPEGDAIANDGDTEIRDEILALWSPRPALVFGSHRAPFPTGYRMALVWDKGEAAGMGDLSIPWKPNWELIFVLGVGFVGARTGGVLRAYVPPRVAMGRVHPNQKPVDLTRDLIGKCPPGVIADPFMGSGTTLRAAKDLGRKAIGVELEERYCEIAALRMGQEVLDLGGAA
jgi:hypothetical protein